MSARFADVLSLLASPAVREVITADVVSRYPLEGCGVVFADRSYIKGTARPIANVADKPASHFRMDEHDLLRAILDGQEKGLELVAIYHSHPDAEAYLSAEDRSGMVVNQYPLYPDVIQVVLAVSSDGVGSCAAYGWSPSARDYMLIMHKSLKNKDFPPNIAEKT